VTNTADHEVKGPDATARHNTSGFQGVGACLPDRQALAPTKAVAQRLPFAAQFPRALIYGLDSTQYIARRRFALRLRNSSAIMFRCNRGRL